MKKNHEKSTWVSIGLKICGDNAIKEFHAPPPQVGGVSGSVNTVTPKGPKTNEVNHMSLLRHCLSHSQL